MFLGRFFLFFYQRGRETIGNILGDGDVVYQANFGEVKVF